jgi:hypothetical protein
MLPGIRDRVIFQSERPPEAVRVVIKYEHFTGEQPTGRPYGPAVEIPGMIIKLSISQGLAIRKLRLFRSFARLVLLYARSKN